MAPNKALSRRSPNVLIARNQPTNFLDESKWIEMFRSVGYLSDHDAPVGGPSEVWRGCARDHWRGMSWTTDEDIARRFAEKVPGPSAVYKVTVPSEAILARFRWNNYEEEEAEVVVDPQLLPETPESASVVQFLEKGPKSN